MKKKILAIVMTVAMCTLMSATAFAKSPSTSASSSSGGSSSKKTSSSTSNRNTESTKGNVNTDSVVVASVGADGSVTKVNLTQYTKQVDNAVINVVANSAAHGVSAGEAVSAVLTTPASDVFKATINALGGKIKLVNTGGYKVAATSAAGNGKTVASVGAIKGVTKYAFVILTAVNADGTVEIVEGTVDPVSLQVMGVFNGTPKTIAVSVIVPAS